MIDGADADQFMADIQKQLENWPIYEDRRMHEHLKKRDQVREITREVMQTFGTLQPKLEHFATTPLPDKASVIQILDDLLEVIYPGYFGRKYVESSNIEYYIGDLLDSIYARLTQEIYRSVRPECESASDRHLRPLPRNRRRTGACSSCGSCRDLRSRLSR